MIIRKFVLIFLILFSNFSFAQIKSADKFFDQYNYAEAAHIYHRYVKKHDDPKVILRLADCYRYLKEYQQAEIYYSKFIALVPGDTVSHFHYGEVLMNNNKYDLAKEQFQIFSSMTPNNSIGRLMVRSCDDIKDWAMITARYKIRNIESINTEFSEFSAVEYGSDIVFVSDRMEDNVTGLSSGWNNRPYLKILRAGKTGIDSTQFKKVKLFSSKLNHDFHNGPISFSGDLKQAYFNRTNESRDHKKTIRPGIVYSENKSGKWTRPVNFDNSYSEEFTFGHPFVSKDGQFLFFASDKPGGFGGKDIYYCLRKEDKWSEPINAGRFVNTLADEVFPTLGPDNILYFSSPGHEGLGGLDIFSAKWIEGYWVDVQNLLAPVNSSTDDFGFYFKEDNTTGYFSSNRPGGKGSDDIYYFETDNSLQDLIGKLFSDNLISTPNKKLNLIDENGNIIQTTLSDSSGKFSFRNLSPDKYFMVKVESNDDPELNKKYYLADVKDRVVSRSDQIENERYIFENLPADFSKLAQFDPDDTHFKKLEGNLFRGEGLQDPLANKRIHLTDKDGKILQTIHTNEAGGFKFTRLPGDEIFLIKLDPADEAFNKDSRIFLRDKKGKEILVSGPDQKGSFVFEMLASDQSVMSMIAIDNTRIKISNLKGKLSNGDNNEAIAGTRVGLYDENGNLIRTATTDKNGRFIFLNLPPDNNYIFGFEPEDTKLLPGHIIVAGMDGNIILDFMKPETGGFKYKILPQELNKLSFLESEDVVLRRSMRGKIAGGDNNEIQIAGARVNLMDENGNIVASGVTDANGNFIFRNLPSDKNFILNLDTEDPVVKKFNRVALLNEKGETIKTTENMNGAFSFTVLPYEKSSMSLLEYEDIQPKKTMRGKFNSADEGKAPVENVKVNLYNDAGEMIGTAYTDKTGAFEFVNLPSDQNYVVMLDADDPKARSLKRVVLSNEKGKEIAAAQMGINGFKFEVLGHDENFFRSSIVAEEIAFRKRVFLEGMIRGEDSTALPNIHIYVYDENGDIIQSGISDGNGKFKFINLLSDKNFILKLNGTDPALSGRGKIFILDKKGKIISVSMPNSSGDFKFVLLGSEKNSMSLISEEDVVLSSQLKGRLFNENKQAIANVKVDVFNAAGELIGEATTDSEGNFIFKNLPPDQNYMVKLNPGETKLNAKKIVLANEKGEVMSTALNDPKSGFNFQLLTTERNYLSMITTDDTDLMKEIKGKLITETGPLVGVLMMLIDDKGEVFQSSRTDRIGSFRFINLPLEQNFLIMLDEKDPKIKFHNRVFITDNRGKVLKEFLRNEDGNFVYAILPHEHNKMKDEIMDDPGFKSSGNSNLNHKGLDQRVYLTSDTIYFDLNKYKLDLVKNKEILGLFLEKLKNDPALNLEIASFADSRGTERYNLELTRQRNQSVLNYLTSQGIRLKQIKTVANGEKTIINGCFDQIDCPEEKHQENRRTELRVYKK